MDPNILIQLEASITGLINRIIQQATIGSIPLATETVNGLTRLANTLTSTDTDRALTAAQGKALKDILDQVNTIIASNDTSLDTLQKVVNYIKANRSSIDSLNQSVSLIELELVNVVRTNDSRLTDAREWMASTVSQAEAESGTATTRRAFTAQRVRQSIAAYTQPFTAADRSKLDGIQAGAQVNSVTSVAGHTGAVTLTAADVGLGNVNNTADSAKSVASAATLTTTRTINGTQFDGSANIVTATWGTARNITIGNTTRSINGSDNVSWTLSDIGALGNNGPQAITKPIHVANSNNQHLELLAPNSGANSGEVSLRFRQQSQFDHQIRARSDGFYFTVGDSGQAQRLHGVFRGSFEGIGWRRFHLDMGIYTPQPGANAGPGRWFIRLIPTNAGPQSIAVKALVNGGWSHSPVTGFCEKEFAFHYDQASNSFSIANQRITSLTGAAAENIRIGDLAIVSGFVGFYVWVNNTNFPFVQLDFYNYPLTLAPSASGWESNPLPARTPITMDALELSPGEGNITIRTGPLNSRRGIVGFCTDNDFWSIYGGGSTSDQGFMDIATGDNGTEPIHVSQFTGGSPIPITGVNLGTLVRRATLLDANGNTAFPGRLTTAGYYCDGAFHQREASTTGTITGNTANVWQVDDPGTTRTININNVSDMLGSLTFILRMVGNRATNWPANINWADGVAPVLGPNWTIVVITRINSTWFGSVGPSR